MLEELNAFRIQNAEKDRLVELENRVTDLEQYSWINDEFVTGLRITPRSYARVVTAANGMEPSDTDDRSAEQQVAAFLHSKGIQVDLNTTETCHPLVRRYASAISMWCMNTKHKSSLLKITNKKQKISKYQQTEMEEFDYIDECISTICSMIQCQCLQFMTSVTATSQSSKQYTEE